MELSIVMPCRDEAETLETCVAKARRLPRRVGRRRRDHRRRQRLDGRLGRRWPGGSASGWSRCADPGYGAALMGGILAARGTFVVMGDADDSYDFSALEPFLTALRDGADLVMGDRFAGGIDEGAMPALNRYVGNPALSFLGRLFFHIGHPRLPLRAARLPPRRHPRPRPPLARHGVRQRDGGEGQPERPEGRPRCRPACTATAARRPPHLRAWRDGWRHLRFLLLYSPRWLFFYPGLVLLLVGRRVRCRADVHRRHDRPGHVQHRHAGGLRRPGAHRLPVGLVRPAVQVLRQPRGPAAGRPAGRRSSGVGSRSSLGWSCRRSRSWSAWRGLIGGGGRVGLRAPRPDPLDAGRSSRR